MGSVTSLQVIFLLLWVHGAVIRSGVSGYVNNVEGYGRADLCQSTGILSWKVSRVGYNDLELSNCDWNSNLAQGDQLLLYVMHGGANDYGLFEIVTVKQLQVNAQQWQHSCTVSIESAMKRVHVGNRKKCLIAQKFPHFDSVNLHDGCVLTCNGQNGGLGGILAFRATHLIMQGNSKIDMTGKGLRGAEGGHSAGAGGAGGESQYCLELAGQGGLVCPSPCAAGSGGSAGNSGAAGGDEESPRDEQFIRMLMGEGGGGGGGSDSSNNVPGGRGGNGGGLVFLMVDQLVMSYNSEIVADGQPGSCRDNYGRNVAAGGNGGGGSVVILARTFTDAYPWARISINGASSANCRGGGGGGSGTWGVFAGGYRVCSDYGGACGKLPDEFGNFMNNN